MSLEDPGGHPLRDLSELTLVCACGETYTAWYRRKKRCDKCRYLHDKQRGIRAKRKAARPQPKKSWRFSQGMRMLVPKEKP